MTSTKSKEFKHFKGGSFLVNYFLKNYCLLFGRNLFRYDKTKGGIISSVDFQKIMTTVKSHLLTQFVRDNLVAVSGGAVSHQVGVSID